MKTTQAHELASAKAVLIPSLGAVFVLYVLPFGSLPVISVGSALLFTLVFGLNQDRFRSRSRSLRPAFCLLAWM